MHSISIHAFADLFDIPRSAFYDRPLSALVSFASYAIGDLAEAFYEAAAPEMADLLSGSERVRHFIDLWAATGYDRSILENNGDLFFGYTAAYQRMLEPPTVEQATAVLRALPSLRAGGHDRRTFQPLAYDRKLVHICTDIAEVLDEAPDIAFEYLVALVPYASAAGGPRW